MLMSPWISSAVFAFLSSAILRGLYIDCTVVEKPPMYAPTLDWTLGKIFFFLFSDCMGVWPMLFSQALVDVLFMNYLTGASL